MIASKVAFGVLQSAAEQVGVSVEIKALNSKGTRFQVKVNTGILEPSDTPEHGSDMRTESGRRRTQYHKYQRTSASTYNAGRRVHAVCWHGFRDFFRAVYRQQPDACFRTAFDTWKGSADFEARYRFSGHRNIGSQVAPMMAAEACVCPESGMAL